MTKCYSEEFCCKRTVWSEMTSRRSMFLTAKKVSLILRCCFSGGNVLIVKKTKRIWEKGKIIARTIAWDRQECLILYKSIGSLYVARGNVWEGCMGKYVVMGMRNFSSDCTVFRDIEQCSASRQLDIIESMCLESILAVCQSVFMPIKSNIKNLFLFFDLPLFSSLLFFFFLAHQNKCLQYFTS